jgi:hypothetical protein
MFFSWVSFADLGLLEVHYQQLIGSFHFLHDLVHLDHLADHHIFIELIKEQMLQFVTLMLLFELSKSLVKPSHTL